MMAYTLEGMASGAEMKISTGRSKEALEALLKPTSSHLGGLAKAWNLGFRPATYLSAYVSVIQQVYARCSTHV